MASIVQTAQIELVKIETQKQEKLSELNVKFASSDKAKSSFGYIGIISVTMMYAFFLFNDFLKLFLYICNDYMKKNRTKADLALRQRTQANKTSDHLEQQIENVYSEELETRLRRMHLRLIRAYCNKNSISQV